MGDSQQRVERASRSAASGKGQNWARRYPPLLAFMLAVLISVLVLPSALNLPQANPSTVLEYAPIPPEEDTPPPTSEGSISELGLGTSSSLTTGIGRLPDVRPGRGGLGRKAITKKCVGRPLRQTEDQNAPPCVPYFEGDNGGPTWQGVTENEITVIIYQDTYCVIAGPDGEACTPTRSTYCDLDSPPNTHPNCRGREYASGELLPDDFEVVRIMRAYARFFNDRFQTYNRRVHFYIYWAPADSPSARRAEAGDNWTKLKPFAVVQRPQFGGHDAVYTEAASKRRMMVFGALRPLPGRYFGRLAPMVWNFWPDVEHKADMFASYICQKVAPFQVSHSGNSGDQGKPRKYGFLYTTDPRFSEYEYFASLVKPGIQSCPNGAKVDIAETVTHSRHQYSIDTHPDAPLEARENIAKLIDAKVTTIIWSGGYDAAHSAEAANRNWNPEWVVSGDHWHDKISATRSQNQDVWSHAWLVSNWLREDKFENAPCRQAYRESDPKGRDEDRACDVYRDLFMLFKAIQVAGPYLAPDTVDQGQHAIPRQSSTNPYTAAFFFDPNDFTGVKDAREAWWDPSASDPDGDPDERGCWRLVRGGQRYLAGEWGGGDDVFANRADPCDNQGSDVDINPYGPGG